MNKTVILIKAAQGAVFSRQRKLNKIYLVLFNFGAEKLRNIKGYEVCG